MRYIVIAHFAGAVNKSLLSSLSDAEQCCSQHILYTMRRSSDKWVNECRLLLHIIKFFRSTQYINYFRKNVVHSHSSQHIFGPIAHCVSFSCLLVCHCFLFFFFAHTHTHTQNTIKIDQNLHATETKYTIKQLYITNAVPRRIFRSIIIKCWASRDRQWEFKRTKRNNSIVIWHLESEKVSATRSVETKIF